MFVRPDNRKAAARLRACRGPLVLLVTLLFAAVVFCAPQLPPEALVPRAPVAATSWSAKAVPDRLLVGLRSVARQKHLTDLARATTGQVSKAIAGGSVLVLELPAGSDLMRMRTKCLADPAVAFVEPDLIVYPALTPNDPYYSEQDHLPLIRASEGWDVTTGSSKVVIAFVDTGTDLDHPDLGAKIYTNPAEIAGNHFDDDGNGLVDDVHGWDFYNNTANANPEPNGADDDSNGTADDQVSHGSLTASIAAAVGNNGFGTAGVDWGAKILPVQVFPDDGGTSVSTVIEGIDYAVAMGADIINLSVGGDYAQSFTPAIASAYNAGILVVAAAGNNGQEITDAQSTWESPVCNDGANPATQNHVLAVASTDHNDLRASFSNYDGSSHGHFVDVCAPGQAIFGCGYYDPAFPAFSSHFTTNSGTSFSAPMVSGLAALILAIHPGYGPDQLMDAIKLSCDDIDGINPGFAGKLGAGRINTARALGVQLAPRAPRDVQAQDTPDDQGGSITVAWLKSLDDGAGADSVIEYVIRRRQGVGGAFAEVGSVAAGVTEFADTTVADGMSYYYKVRASDGTLFSDSLIAGPVQSVNDSAPPTPEGVHVQDRPGDNGGAMLVGWNPYTAPADFSHFAIYRRSYNFANVWGLTPISEITDPNLVLFTDETTTDGADYYYAVTAVDTFGNENKTVAGLGPAQSYANEPITLGAGLHFFSTPVVPENTAPAAFLGVPEGQFNFARWRPIGEEYAYYGASADLPGVLELRLGRGYWLRNDAPITFDPTGTPAPGGDVRVELRPGWHQLGNPYFGPMDFALATVTYQGTTMDLASADAGNIMRRFAWVYGEEQGGYRLLCPGLCPGNTRVPAWKGLWVRVEKLCTVTLPRPSGVASAVAATSKSCGWVARLAARAGARQDLDNFFGVRADFADRAPISSPPSMGQGVELYFVRASAPGEKLAAVFASAPPAEISWKFVVGAAQGTREVELWCPDLAEVPRDYSVFVEDVDTGRQVDLRRNGRYRYAFRDGERARSFVLRLTRNAGVLTLSSLVGQATRGGGAQITFTLSAPAMSTVRVLNIAGRNVRTIEQGRSRPAGVSQVIWDGRGEAGTRAPNGTYLVLVEAAATDGSKVRAMRSLMIRR